MLADAREQTLIDTIAREASEMPGFPMVAIELCDFDRSVMVYRVVHGIYLAGLPQPFEIPMDVTLSGRVAHTGETLVETDAARCREISAPILRKLGMETIVCLPIRPNGKVVGTLSLAHQRRIEVDPRVVKHVASLANFLATLFDRIHAREAVRRGEAELAAVYDHAPNILCLFDEQLRIVRANNAAAEFTGFSKDKLASLRFGNFLKCPAGAGGGGGGGNSERCANRELRRAITETLTSNKRWHRVRV